MQLLEGMFAYAFSRTSLTSLPRRHNIHRDTLTAASAIYKGMSFVAVLSSCTHLIVAMHGNEDGTIPATFQVIFMVGVTFDSGVVKN